MLSLSNSRGESGSKGCYASGSTSQLEFVDERSRLFAEKLTSSYSKKFGSNQEEHPDFDHEIWDECTWGRKNGRGYASGTPSHRCYVLTGRPSTCSTSTYAMQQPQVQMLTSTIEEMQEKYELQHKEIEEMKSRDERQRHELEEVKAKNIEIVAKNEEMRAKNDEMHVKHEEMCAKNEEMHANHEAETNEMKKTIAALVKYLPNMESSS